MSELNDEPNVPRDHGDGSMQAGAVPIPIDDLDDTDAIELDEAIEAEIEQRLLAPRRVPRRARKRAERAVPRLLESSARRALPTRAVDQLAERGRLLWEHPAFAARVASLDAEIEDVWRSLAATLRQDLTVHDQVLSRARDEARVVALRVAAVGPDTDQALARTLLTDARAALADLLGERLIRRFERFYNHDEVIIGLEHAIERLDTLPEALPKETRLEFAPGTWPGMRSRLPLLRSRPVEIEVPLRASVECALMRADTGRLTHFFKKLLAARDHLKRTLRAVRDHVLAELDAAIVAADLNAAVDPDDERDDDEVRASTVQTIAAVLGVGERARDERPVLERAREAVLEVEHAVASADEPLDDIYDKIATTTHDIADALHASVVEAVGRHDTSSRLGLSVERATIALRWRARRRLAHVRGADVERQQQRVRYHPQLRKFLADLETEIDGFLVPLEDGTRADMARHVELFDALREALRHGIERLEIAFERFDPASRGGLRSLKRGAQRQTKRIYHALEKKLLGPLWMHYGDDPLQARLKTAIERAARLDAGLGTLELGYEQRAAIGDSDAAPAGSDDLPARQKRRRRRRGQLVRVRTGAIVEQWLTRRRVGELERHATELGELRTALVRRLQDVWNIVRYNIEGAMAEADEAQALDDDERPADAWDKCRDMAVGGMRRALDRLDGILEELGQFHLRTTQDFRKRLALTEPIARDAAAAATFRGNLRFWKTEIEVESAQAWQAVQRFSARSADRAAGWTVRSARTVFGNRLLRELLGLSTDQGPALEAQDDVARLTAPVEQLPPVYRRLFALEPLVLDEFLVARDNSMRQLDRAFRAWSLGQPRSVLIYGDPGSGKRSFVNCGLDHFGEATPVHRVRLDKRWAAAGDALADLERFFGLEPDPTPLASDDPDARVDRLAERLLATPRCVMIVERLHLGFVRRIGGFDGLRTLLMVIGRTAGHIFWVASLEAHPYALLQRLWRVGDAFSHVLPMKSLDAEQLERAVMARHELSGYKLRFEADELTAQRLRRELRRVRGDRVLEQEILGRHFYRTLYEASGGNVYNAILHWLSAVTRAPDDSELVVSMVEPPEPPGLDRLTTDHIYALTAILLHGALNTRELSTVLDWELSRARLVMQFLSHRSFVHREGRYESGVSEDDEQTEETDQRRHRVAQIMIKPVVRTLMARNIVHWPSP